MSVNGSRATSPRAGLPLLLLSGLLISTVAIRGSIAAPDPAQAFFGAGRPSAASGVQPLTNAQTQRLARERV